MTLTEIDGSYYLVDENNEIEATIGDIIIFTADEKNNTFGKFETETIIENWEYRMTIVLDAEYLAASETAYPIRIDPTIEISYDNDGVGTIEDVTINSLKGSSGSSGSLSVGLREKYGISRILMKFPGLDLSSLGSNIEITNATVELRDLMCEGTYLTVECCVFSGNEWTESTANWSNVSPNSVSTYLSSNSISYYNGVSLSPKHRYSFDITEAVKGWKAGNYNQNKGIIFKATSSVENGSTYNSRTMASYNRASNKPTLSVTYSNSPSNYRLLSDSTYYLNNKYSGKYMKFMSSTVSGESGLLSSLGISIQWEIRGVDGGYIIRSKTDTTKYLGVPSSTSSTSVSIVTVKDSTIPARCVWTIAMASNGTGYTIKNNYNAKYLYTFGTVLYTNSSMGTSGSSTYDSRVWRIVRTSSYGNTAAYYMRELESGFSIENMALNVGDSVTPKITKSPSNVIWASASDFKYTYLSGTSGCVSFIASTGKAKAISPGIVTILATHKITNQTYKFKVYIDRYMWELVNTFGFSDSNALLIREIYEKMDDKFPDESEMYKAWKCARLLGGIIYDNLVTKYDLSMETLKNIGMETLWKDVAGQVYVTSEKDYYVNTLGYTESEYTQLKNAIHQQYSEGKAIDFAHMQMSLATRLAYKLGTDGFFSDFGNFCVDEDISYMGGWLGDAVLAESGTTSIKNDDYCADLDAENIYRLIVSGKTTAEAMNTYYANLTTSNTRADIFLSYIDYTTIEEKVFYYLIDMELYKCRDVAASYGDVEGLFYYDDLIKNEQYHWEKIKSKYSDTYNFLKSLENGLANIATY